ncbi:MAG: hypothetical protein O7C59_08105, partial [Rickettsia endosymbiont of Ixodes persulcatus]|nr:hypothetical protein [Rickettsia endosymbiont of Ixodes persulcatus]
MDNAMPRVVAPSLHSAITCCYCWPFAVVSSLSASIVGVWFSRVGDWLALVGSSVMPYTNATISWVFFAFAFYFNLYFLFFLCCFLWLSYLPICIWFIPMLETCLYWPFYL